MGVVKVSKRTEQGRHHCARPVIVPFLFSYVYSKKRKGLIHDENIFD